MIEGDETLKGQPVAVPICSQSCGVVMGKHAWRDGDHELQSLVLSPAERPVQKVNVTTMFFFSTAIYLERRERERERE